MEVQSVQVPKPRRQPRDPCGCVVLTGKPGIPGLREEASRQARVRDCAREGPGVLGQARPAEAEGVEAWRRRMWETEADPTERVWQEASFCGPWVSHASELSGVATPVYGSTWTRRRQRKRGPGPSPYPPNPEHPSSALSPNTPLGTQPQPRPGLCRLRLFVLDPAGPLSSPEAGRRLRWSPEGRPPISPLSIGVCLCSWLATSQSSWLAPSWGLRVLLTVFAEGLLGAPCSPPPA